jgi:hypothetical protein
MGQVVMVLTNWLLMSKIHANTFYFFIPFLYENTIRFFYIFLRDIVVCMKTKHFF